MIVVNLLEFLNNIKVISALEYAQCAPQLIDYLDLMSEEEQFTRKIDLGIMYLHDKIANQYIIIDGLNRVLSLSLLLHAICECYKKTSPRNDKAIRRIRSKYLLNGTKTKLRLPKDLQIVYEKIIYGERLSGHEKDTPMFQLLHNLWTKIKENGLLAANIFRMLEKIQITIVETDNVSDRDLYYNLNRNNKDLNQLLLIENYLKSYNIKDEWNEFKNIYADNVADMELFFKDFFITKFNFKEFEERRLYEHFENYFDTMRMYQEPKIIMSNILKDAKLYNNLLNVNISDENIRKAFIKIKMNNGEDTYAYLLGIYEDYLEGNITQGTFIEILDTINEYLQNRIKTPNNVGFNELIQYLNAFITCK